MRQRLWEHCFTSVAGQTKAQAIGGNQDKDSWKEQSNVFDAPRAPALAFPLKGRVCLPIPKTRQGRMCARTKDESCGHIETKKERKLYIYVGTNRYYLVACNQTSSQYRPVTLKLQSTILETFIFCILSFHHFIASLAMKPHSEIILAAGELKKEMDSRLQNSDGLSFIKYLLFIHFINQNKPR